MNMHQPSGAGSNTTFCVAQSGICSQNLRHTDRKHERLTFCFLFLIQNTQGVRFFFLPHLFFALQSCRSNSKFAAYITNLR